MSKRRYSYGEAFCALCSLLSEFFQVMKEDGIDENTLDYIAGHLAKAIESYSEMNLSEDTSLLIHKGPRCNDGDVKGALSILKRFSVTYFAEMDQVEARNESSGNQGQ